MKQISILGCGWLGLPLAKSLLKKGFSINGSTTSVEKIAVLEKAGISAFQINLFEDRIEGNLDLFLSNSDVLIIDIPPKLRGDSKENFVTKIQNIIPFIEKSSVEKVIFVSSTSVYEDTSDLHNVSEETKPNPDTESGKQLLEAEQLLQSNKNFQTTIVRFGGLIGEDRHPIKFLAGRKNIENPEGPINLIHQVDCIGIIEAIYETNSWQETYNAVTPYHPIRKEYYTHKAIELNLPLPEFDESKISIGKTILSKKVIETLNYNYSFPEL